MSAKDRSVTNRFGVADGRLQEHSVASQELGKGVADGIAQFPDADGIHHAGVSQLTRTKFAVKVLGVAEQIRA